MADVMTSITLPSGVTYDVYDKSASRVVVIGSSDTWAQIFAKLNALENEKAALFYASDASTLTNSKYTGTTAKGIVVRTVVNSVVYFSFMAYIGTQKFVLFSFSNATSSSRGTESYSDYYQQAYHNKKQDLNGGVTLVRNGNVVWIACNANNFTATADAVIDCVTSGKTGTVVVPTGYKPVYAVSLRDTLNNKRLTIYPNGNVTANEAFTNTGLRFSATWITDDSYPA